MWRVQLAAHAVPPRWHVPAQTVELPAVDAEQACGFAISMAHAAAGVPPWKPCVRASLAFASVERARNPKVAALPARRPETQLSLADCGLAA